MIDNLELGLDFLIVDDNSPDGTADIVKNLCKGNINLIVQKSKSGLGTAYKKGFQWSIDNN